VLTIASSTGSGLLTAAILAGLARALRRRGDGRAKDTPLEVRVVDTSGGSSREYIIRGTSDAVLAAIDALEPHRLFDTDADAEPLNGSQPLEEDAQ
jgi:hypothetical protein